MEVAVAEPFIASTEIPSGRRPMRGLVLMIAFAAAFMLLCSSVRHYVLRSGAMDLGFFDQAVYLISQGQTPVSSFHGFHVLGDHASLILYPLALFYLLWSNPHVLLIVQAIALAAGAWPIWRLARLARISEGVSFSIAAAYLMSPILLAANVFDFHPEVLAVPALLMAVLMARENKRVAFCVWLVVALSCKEIVAVTVGGMGLWLLLAERRRFAGFAAMVVSVLWFFIASKLVIAYFGDGRNPSGLQFYGYLGHSMGEIVLNTFLKPQLILGHLFNLRSLKYVVALVVPVIWALHPRVMWPLLSAAPIVLLNLLSDFEGQQNVFSHYSIVIVPFLFLAIILAVSNRKAWLSTSRGIIGWSILILVVGLAGRLGRLDSKQTFDFDAIRNTREAIKLVEPGATVLTTFEIVPHLSDRQLVSYIGSEVPHKPAESYDFILVNTEHGSVTYGRGVEEVRDILQRVVVSPRYKAIYLAPDIYLYKRLNDQHDKAEVAFKP